MSSLLGFPDFLHSAGDDVPLSDAPTDDGEFSDVACPLDKVFEDAHLAAALHLRDGHRHVHNFHVETAHIDARAERIYKGIAADAATKIPPPDTHTLAKRARGTRKVVYGDPHDTRTVAKTDVTNYSDGTKLIAEMDENGRIFRIVEETTA